MSIRDLLLNVLIGFGMSFFILFVITVDSLPVWLLLIVAAIAWGAYIVIVIRDHSRDIRYPVLRYRPDKTRVRVARNPQTTPYDQEEDKE